MNYADDIIDTLVDNDRNENKDFKNLSNTIDELYDMITEELETNIKRAVDNNKKFMILYTYKRNQVYNNQKIYYMVKDCSKFMNRNGKTNLLEKLEHHKLLTNFKIEHYFNKRTELNEIKIIFVEETDSSRFRRYLKNKK